MSRFSRPASHTPSAATIVVAALLAAGLLAGLAYLAWVAPRGVPGLRYYDLDAQFTNAAQIADLAPVRIAGRNVGQVVSSDYRDGHAVVHLALYPGNGPLRSDTRAEIRLQGLLGGKYVELTPGRSGRSLPSGATLPGRQTATAVDIITALQTFDLPARRHLQTALHGLGQGFLGRGPSLAKALTVAPAFAGDVGAVSAAITARSGAAARFAPSAERLAGAYDPVRDELARGLEPQSRVLGAIAGEAHAVQATLSAAPASLHALHDGLDAASPLLRETAGLARATIRLTRRAPLALARTRRLLLAGAPALRATGPPVRTLARATPDTLTLLRRLDPAIAPVIATLQRSIGLLTELGGHSCDVLAMWANWRSALSFGVGTGSGLSGGEQGLGGVLTSLRVLPVRLLGELDSDAPPASPPAHDAYPRPCVAEGER